MATPLNRHVDFRHLYNALRATFVGCEIENKLGHHTIYTQTTNVTN